jgi:predicted Zn-dependent protease
MSDERSTLRNLFFEAIDDMGCRNWGSAERKLSFIHGRMPDRSSVTINLALVYLNMNRVSEARVLMDTLGTQVSPEHFKKFSVVSAQVYLAMNNPDEALQALEIATQKGVFSMQDVVSLYQVLKQLEDKLKSTQPTQS